MVRLSTTGKPNASDHDGCLAFVRARPLPRPAIWYVCTDPAKHDAGLSAEQAARAKAKAEEEAAQAQARQAERQEAEKRAESARVASLLRSDTALSAVKPKPALDPTLERLFRATLPALIYSISEYVDPAHFFESRRHQRGETARPGRDRGMGPGPPQPLERRSDQGCSPRSSSPRPRIA
ncbi:hypothetical protein G5V59_00375 [Nocardioides sp. W3-2-3]|uniref:hypothetical protein n=1 Tax=Nocardioides convexus TaxID=2712224 RepID=UPI0024186A77|nr:hypothetical protein [Nocardioides convexus]NGZ99426.1 hypothetical protein [Nocardioides convexus]